MAGLTEQDIENLKKLSKPPQVDVKDLVPNPDVKMQKVETLGGTIPKQASKNTGRLEEGLGADIVADQEYLPEKS